MIFMDILPAKLTDLNPLRRLEKICFPQDAWPIFDLVAVLTFNDVVRLKAVEDGQMIGFIAGDPRRSQGFSWIATVAVLPEYQRQGVGSALLERCEAELSTPRVRLCVRTGNTDAIRLYERSGYRVIDTWRRYYHDGGDALVMEKQLI